MSKINYNDVIEANVELHTALSNVYRDIEPHYREENIKKIKKIIEKLKHQSHGESLLDIGCGMGFIIDIAKEYFSTIKGIDITPAMLEKVDTDCDKCDIELILSPIEKMPFDSNTFDVCTAYAVIHHLSDVEKAMNEVYRVLKKGGIFYSALDPNYYFWKSIDELDNRNYSNIIEREINSVKHKDEEIQELYGVDASIVDKAESYKHIEGGFKEELLKEIFNKVGFKHVDIKYEWFLGEGKLIHDTSLQEHVVDAIRNHLDEMLPISRNLYKYISIKAQK